MATALESLIAQFESKEAAARQANITRQQQITAIFDEIITRYGPEGTYGAAALEQLRGEKVRDVSAAEQTDISRGLYGVSPRGTEWEAAVGAPARLKLEDIKMERLSQAQLGKAGFMERIEEPYPDYGALMTAAQAGGGVGGRGGFTFTGGGSTGFMEGYGGVSATPSAPLDEPYYTVQMAAKEGYEYGVPTAGLKVPSGTEGAQPESWFAQQGKPTVSPTFRKTAEKAQKWLGSSTYGARG